MEGFMNTEICSVNDAPEPSGPTAKTNTPTTRGNKRSSRKRNSPKRKFTVEQVTDPATIAWLDGGGRGPMPSM
jgi:hypothetical protein